MNENRSTKGAGPDALPPNTPSLAPAGRTLDTSQLGTLPEYNCSYLPIDDPKAFDEAMYILLCGTGVGFSVERQYVAKLPEVPAELVDSDESILAIIFTITLTSSLGIVVPLLVYLDTRGLCLCLELTYPYLYISINI